MNDTLENGTNSSIPSSSSEDDTRLAPLLTAFNSINLILGLPINSYVMWLILSGAGGTIASEFFNLNLIVSVIITFLSSVFNIAWLFTRNYILHMVIKCIYAFFFWISVPLFQCCICVERYIAVIHPVVFLSYKHLRYKVACCCVVWLTALAFSLIRFWSPKVGCYIFFGFCVMCISVVSFCCLSVLRALKQPGPGEGQRDRGEGQDVKRRAFRIILTSLVVMSVTMMSLIIFVLSIILVYIPAAAIDITYAIALMSVFAHPLLYLYKAGKLPCFKGL